MIDQAAAAQRAARLRGHRAASVGEECRGGAVRHAGRGEPDAQGAGAASRGQAVPSSEPRHLPDRRRTGLSAAGPQRLQADRRCHQAHHGFRRHRHPHRERHAVFRGGVACPTSERVPGRSSRHRPASGEQQRAGGLLTRRRGCRGPAWSRPLSGSVQRAHRCGGDRSRRGADARCETRRAGGSRGADALAACARRRAQGLASLVSVARASTRSVLPEVPPSTIPACC